MPKSLGLGHKKIQRDRAIKRKEGICRRIGGVQLVEALTAGGESKGRLDKGKIHCSCWMCRTKSYDGISHRDEKLLLKLAQQLEDY